MDRREGAPDQAGSIDDAVSEVGTSSGIDEGGTGGEVVHRVVSKPGGAPDEVPPPDDPNAG